MLPTPVLPLPCADATESPLTRVRTSELPCTVTLPAADPDSPVRPPTSWLAIVTAGSNPAIDAAFRPDGSAPINSSFNTCWRIVLCTSTTGDSPLTVIVSSSAPTRISVLTEATKAPVSSMPSRFEVANPGSVKVTV